MPTNGTKGCLSPHSFITATTTSNAFQGYNYEDNRARVRDAHHTHSTQPSSFEHALSGPEAGFLEVVALKRLEHTHPHLSFSSRLGDTGQAREVHTQTLASAERKSGNTALRGNTGKT